MPPVVESNLLCVDQVVQDDLLGAVVDVVHGPHPGHLVAGFEGFGDALALGHLGGEALQHFVGLAVDLLQVGVETALQEHAVEDAAVVAAQVLVAHSAVFADLWGLRGLQIGDQIVAFPVISQFLHGVLLSSVSVSVRLPMGFLWTAYHGSCPIKRLVSGYFRFFRWCTVVSRYSGWVSRRTCFLLAFNSLSSRASTSSVGFPVWIR